MMMCLCTWAAIKKCLNMSLMPSLTAPSILSLGGHSIIADAWLSIEMHDGVKIIGVGAFNCGAHISKRNKMGRNHHPSSCQQHHSKDYFFVVVVLHRLLAAGKEDGKSTLKS